MAHGLTITESTSGARTVQDPSLSAIGIVATATAAGAEASAALDAEFPIGVAVLVTDIDAALKRAGDGGTLGPALEAIGDQTTPILVVVRAEPGTGEDADEQTDDNVIEAIGALLTAGSTLGVAPRIIGAPGLDTQAVTAELVVAAKRLRAMVYARALGADAAAAALYRNNFGARELMLIWPGTADAFPGDAVARALGLRARIDEAVGWHKSISNVAMDGVTALDHAVQFDLLDNSTEAGVLNDADVTTIIRRDGFRFWGNRTTAGAEMPEFSFEVAVRTLHALQDVIVDVFGAFFDQPMTVALVKDLLETANAKARQLTLAGKIMGAKFQFPASTNSADQLAAGRPHFRITFTPVAPMENPNIEIEITDEFYDGFADRILTA